MSRQAHVLAAVAAPVCIVILGISGVLLGGWLPPQIGPGDSAAVVAGYYAQNALRVRVGAVLAMISFGVIPVWGAAMAAQTRRKEGAFPVLAYVQVACMAVETAQIVLNTALWATAAFRAGEVSPEITQTLNDAGFIIFLGTWIPFTLWAVALGLSVLLDRSGSPVYPRWSGYLSIWVGIGYLPCVTVWFFKDGPFGWQGIVCMGVPIIVFGIWLLTFSALTVRNVRAGFLHEQDLDDTSRMGTGAPP